MVNSFLHRWGLHGYEAGWLKYPTTDEVVLPDGGRRQEFQDGAIYVAFQNAIGSAIRNGPLRDKWNSVGAETPGSLLGYPIQDQIPLPDGQGQMDRFERGVIYWHPIHGAHPVTGPILDQWSAAGYEQSNFGYPTADQISVVGIAHEQQFQTGLLYSPPRASADNVFHDWVQDSGQSQCSLPIASRVDAWACQQSPRVPSAAPDPQARAAAVSEYCDPSFGGCWRQYDDFRADYEVNVIFGADDQIIGQGTGYVEWQLAGPYTSIRNAYLTSHDAVLSRVVFSGALQNGAVGVENGGSLIHKTQPQFVNGPHIVGNPVHPGDLSKFTLEDRKMDDHNYAFQISAEFSEWPGYWYFWVRSPVAHYDEEDPDDIYRFQGAGQLPGNPVGAGWNW